MNDPKPAAERESSPAGSALRHALFSAAMWITFAIYWNLVLGRGIGREARVTLVFLALFVLLQISFTLAWVGYNRGIARRFAGRRNRRPPAERRVEADFLGRRLEFDPPEFDLTTAPSIRIRVVGDVKRFETRLALGDARAAAGE